MKKVTLKNGFQFIGSLVSGGREFDACIFSVDSGSSREINPCYSFERELFAPGIINVGLWAWAISNVENL